MHRIDGPGATVDNKFTEGDPVGGIQATVVTDDFLNDVQEELISVLTAGGVEPVKGTQDQVLQAIYKLVQAQKATAFLAGGTSTALTLTPTPAISAYAANQRFTVRFPVNSGLNPTLNVSAKGPKALKQYDSSGAKVAATFVADQISDVINDGIDWVLMDQVASSNLVGVQGVFSNLKITSSGTSSNIVITADEIILESAAGYFSTIRNVAATLSVTAVGANGLDTGTLAASTWYSLWVIWNPSTNTAAGLISLSLSAPVMPSGYTHKARVSTIRTDGTANKFPFPFTQFGKSVNYNPLAGTNLLQFPAIASGSATWPTSAGWQGYAPPWCSKLVVLIQHAQAGQVSFSNSPNYQLYNDFGVTGNTNYDTLVCHPLNASIYYAAQGGTSGTALIQMMGWEENL